jgi:CheY-like chemotaxis protein
MVPLAAERNIQLQELAHGQCEAHVVADLQRLKQVLLNLISNALKYNHDGGQVTLFCEEKREGILRINIRDTGPGIAPDNLHRIFEPFERLDADARGVEGSGVGLALSKALIEAMGGVLGVDSQVGAGSTFWIELAIIDPPSAGDAAQHRQQKTLAQPDLDNSQTATVLYIEDNIANFRLVEVALSRRPHIQLITAMEGQLGIELALRHQPDVILLDIHLPVLMGDKVLARLRAEPETQHIPIVVVSADATQPKVEKLLAAGAHSYLTKPFNIKELLRTVDSLLETRSN